MKIIANKINNYISTEDKLYEWRIGQSDLVITTKKICSLTRMENFTYKEIPIERLGYAQNTFGSRRWSLFVLGILMIIFTIILGFLLYPINMLIFPIPIYIVTVGLGIWLIIKGLKRGGALIINKKSWKIPYNGIEDINKVQEFLKVVHHITEDHSGTES